MSERALTAVDAIDKGTPRPIVRHVMVGALYGLLTGTAFVLMSAFIDVWLHPNLPLGVDWTLMSTRWISIGLGLAVIGAATCWPNETWQGLLSGAVVSGAIVLISSLFDSPIRVGMKLIVLVFTLMPVTVMALPIAWILRRLAEKHALALQSEQPAARLALLMLIAIVLGAGSGYFTKMSPREVEVTRYAHELLQNPIDENNPIRNIEEVQAHQGVPYKLYQTQSKVSTEGYDIRVEYEDGFVLQCVAVLYPGRDPYISTCKPER